MSIHKLVCVLVFVFAAHSPDTSNILTLTSPHESFHLDFFIKGAYLQEKHMQAWMLCYVTTPAA